MQQSSGHHKHTTINQRRPSYYVYTDATTINQQSTANHTRCYNQPRWPSCTDATINLGGHRTQMQQSTCGGNIRCNNQNTEAILDSTFDNTQQSTKWVYEVSFVCRLCFVSEVSLKRDYILYQSIVLILFHPSNLICSFILHIQF